MQIHATIRGTVLAALLALGGCGVIYTVPAVEKGPPYSSGTYATGYDVKVVPLTYETAAAANLTPYVPPRLPAAYQPAVARVTQASAAAQPTPPALLPDAGPSAARPRAVSDKLPPSGGSGPYRIGVGDVVLLSISGTPTLAQLPDLITAQAKRDGYTVQGDGAIAIPNVGRVKIAGMTLEDAQYQISQKLLAANIEPSFSLEVSGFNSQHVSVGGLVGTPGLVPITLRPLHLADAIAASGGVASDDPGVTTVQLLRKGTAYRYAVDRFINDPAVRDIVLRNGDSIYVGSAEKVLEARRARAQALFEKRLGLGAVKRYYVFLTGEVRHSGQAELPFDQPVSLANVLFGKPGGGIDAQTGDFGAIYVIRADPDPRKAGGLTAYHLNAANVANLAVAARFQMRPDDIVFVAQQPVTSWNRVLSQIFPIVSAPQQLATSAAGVP